MEKKADVVFELSWEVCNKVGGIYTVVQSKAGQMVANYDSNYFLVGPFFPGKHNPEFSEELPHDFCKNIIEDLKAEGIICHFGKWLIEGSPNVILVDFQEMLKKTNEIKKALWDGYRVDSLRSSFEYDEPVAWAYACGKMIDALQSCMKGKKIVAHCHEWLAASALLYLKSNNPAIATVFTTHATTMGRTLANAQQELYSIWDTINADSEAQRYNVEPKHTLEKAAANTADAFTTVSEITSMEAQRLLGKKADVLLLNGLDIDTFPTIEQSAIKHSAQKERIKQFLTAYFFPYYDFDLENTLIYFLAGRYEFKNKGIDVLISALGELNQKLKNNKDAKTIVVFIFVPGNIRNIKPEVLENKTYFQDIRDSIEEVKETTINNAMLDLLTNKKITSDTLFDKTFLLEMKSKIKRFSKKGLPPLCTHDLASDDAILNACHAAQLENRKEDPVKVIYYPIYLSGADGLLNLTYYETMTGSHLGIFPSYYEPWGYTPLEAGALGVASVTTDLSGFGRFFCNECVQESIPGIYVLQRMHKNYQDTVKQLTEVMFNYQSQSIQQRIQNKMQARRIASMCDWKNFVDNYIEAHNLAVEKSGKEKQ